ncbi:hypothetical protein ColLi_02908 [Colletotrichum liriopes]|uniref:ATP synthase complex subunit H n=1 Tax=Colletotrichum liriopes TaxID=708192 RepID=A0AA37GG86_9PEZI|nr:hypothetical protein ColLi_02908 [Colletotrichum liriopes]
MEVVRIAGAAKGGQAPKLAWGCVSTSDDDIGHQHSASTNTSSSIVLPSSIRHPTHSLFIFPSKEARRRCPPPSSEHHTQSPLPPNVVPNTRCTNQASDTADFVQELYLKELKAYKPTPVKDSDAQGQVQTFSLPQTPNLKEYESMAVEVEGQDASAVAANGEPVKHDWLMIEEDEEEPHH